MTRWIFLFVVLSFVAFGGFATNTMLAGWQAGKTLDAVGTFEASVKGNSEMVRYSKSVVNRENGLKEATRPADDAAERDVTDAETRAIAPEVDFVRIDPLGTSVIAGISTPKSRINIVADGKVIATALVYISGVVMTNNARRTGSRIRAFPA